MEIVKLCKRPDLAEAAARFFAEHWEIAHEVYLESIRAYIDNPKGIPRWYVVCEGGRIAAGAGVIDNDFHERKDLRPNLCALYVRKAFRSRGVARRLLAFALADLADTEYDKLYLVTDHVSFYEKCGWTYLTDVLGEDKLPVRMYFSYIKR